MDRVEVSTVVYLPPADVFEFLIDFPRYAEYSKYLRRVHQEGDGGPGTRYALQFAWWKLSYTARSEVTGLNEPRAIDWELIKDLEADGQWIVEHVPDEAPPDEETASRVRFVAEFDPDSTDRSVLDLPRLVSFGFVVSKVKPVIMEEVERVVERIVADLEGEERPVDVTVHESPSSV